jgi:4-amino-4-deoxy-L-arabinose transferase-like glycosyltransferase
MLAVFWRRRIGFLLCAVVLALSGVFLLHNLAKEPLQDYDEATYTEVVHEALANHQYLSFTYGGQNFFEKPPLSFWAMMLSENALGENEFAQRLPFVVMALLLLAAVMLVVYETSSDALAAALGGAVLASTTPFVMTAREVRMDAPVALFIMLAVYCVLRALNDKRWWLGFGAALACAVLAKSAIAIFAVVAAAALLICFWRFDALKSKNFYYGLLTFLAVVLPWHLYEWAKFGNAFWASYLVRQVFERTQENLFWTVTLTNADYINFLQLFVQPWLALFWLALLSMLLFWRWAPQANKRVVLASAIAMLAMIVVFFESKTKAPTYLVPLYPFGAVVIALGVASIKEKYFYYAAALVAAAVVAHSWQFSYYNAYYQNPYFNVVADMARDERAIAQTIKPLPKQQPVFVYGGVNLGSIIYYSQHFALWGISETSTPATGDYILVNTADQPQFAKAFPQISTGAVYQGKQETLLQILSED